MTYAHSFAADLQDMSQIDGLRSNNRLTESGTSRTRVYFSKNWPVHPWVGQLYVNTSGDLFKFDGEMWTLVDHTVK